MIAHLKGREKAVEELGFRPRDAEWIALVALHSGVFLRSQYSRFCGVRSRTPSRRLVGSLVQNGLAAESDLRGIGSVCRLFSRAVYRAIGAEHIRHRKDAARPEVLRRLLSLDFVLDDLDQAWLPTEPEKVGAFRSLGIQPEALPRRVYGSPKGGRTVRPFGWKMPIAFSGEVARFVYVDTGGETHDELLSWGAEHSRLWSALGARGVCVAAAAVLPSADRLSGAAKILGGWKGGGLKGGGAAGLSDEEVDELGLVEAAIVAFNDVAMARWGGLNGAISRLADLQRRDRLGGASAGSNVVRLDDVEARLSRLSRLVA